MSNPLETRISSLLCEVVPPSLHAASFDAAMSLRMDLAIDSIGLMSLAFRIEEEFELDLGDHIEEVAAVQTVGDVVQIVQRLGADRLGAPAASAEAT